MTKPNNRKKVLPIDNYIAQLLDVIDEDSQVTDFKVEGNIKYVTITKNLRHDLVCPLCGSKLKSKGKFSRHPKHQVLQDGYTLKLIVIGRRWICSNKECDFSCYDQFNFVEPRKQITKLILIRIIMELKDIHLSCSQVAQRFHVSDSYVHQIFMKFVNLKRKPLTEYICIDEVYLNISKNCKYALVIMDFFTGDILDIIESRRQSYTEQYFLSIPIEERNRVKCICCDMYDPYINYTTKYFLHSIAITDSFHVLQWLLKMIRIYINTVKKRYQERDRKKLSEKNEQTNQDNKTIQDSPEVYILKNAQWVILMNRSNWTYFEPHYNYKLGKVMDTYTWENDFLNLDTNFKTIRDLKDLYECFNEEFINDLDGAAKRLDELIEIYKNSEIYIFRDFARLLTKYHQSIVNSFIYVQAERLGSNNDVLRRLSNGPMESFNNIPSALRTQSHGIDNFEFAKNRILWSIRDDAPINIIPLSNDKIHREGKKRGSYKKHID